MKPSIETIKKAAGSDRICQFCYLVGFLHQHLNLHGSSCPPDLMLGNLSLQNTNLNKDHVDAKQFFASFLRNIEKEHLLHGIVLSLCVLLQVYSLLLCFAAGRRMLLPYQNPALCCICRMPRVTGMRFYLVRSGNLTAFSEVRKQSAILPEQAAKHCTGHCEVRPD